DGRASAPRPALLLFAANHGELDPVLRSGLVHSSNELIGGRRRRRIAVLHGRKDFPEELLHSGGNERHEKYRRFAPHVLEPVNGPAWNEDEVSRLCFMEGGA